MLKIISHSSQFHAEDNFMLKIIPCSSQFHAPDNFMLKIISCPLMHREWIVKLKDSKISYLKWMYYSRHAGVGGNDVSDRLAGRAAAMTIRLWVRKT